MIKYCNDLCERELSLFDKTTSILELSKLGNYYLYLELNEKDYFVMISSDSAGRLEYKNIFKITETDTAFYIEYSNNNKSPIPIDKTSCNNEIMEFIKKLKQEIDAIQDNKLFKKKFVCDYVKNGRVVLFVLLILTLIITFFSASIAAFIRNTPLKNNGIWLYFLLLLFPLFSVLTGLKYYRDILCFSRINVVIGFLCGFIIWIIGLTEFSSLLPSSFIESEDPISKYEEILSISVPKSGKLQQLDPTFYGEGNMTETTMMEILYDKDNGEKIVKQISNNEKWFSSFKDMKELEEFLSYQMNSECNNCYYLVYNETKKEYNKFQYREGKYHIYVVSYNLGEYKLKINDFMYEVK